jgi:hypothetical protein
VGRVATLAATEPYIWPIDSSKAESLMFEPWIGPHYDATRLLLLGESAYSWTGRDSTLQHPTPDHCRKLVEWVVGGLEECRSGPEKLPFMVKVSRALANDVWPTEKHLRHVWDHVLFTNYVREPVGHGSRVRPS